MKKLLYTKKEIIDTLDEEIEYFKHMYEHSKGLGMPESIYGKYYATMSELEVLKKHFQSN